MLEGTLGSYLWPTAAGRRKTGIGCGFNQSIAQQRPPRTGRHKYRFSTGAARELQVSIRSSSNTGLS